MAEIRQSQDFCFRGEIKGVAKNCMVLKSAIFEFNKNLKSLSLREGLHEALNERLMITGNYL